jgi:hypothetical protein
MFKRDQPALAQRVRPARDVARRKNALDCAALRVERAAETVADHAAFIRLQSGPFNQSVFRCMTD